MNMEENKKKIFTNKAISVATFFGGPLAAGFLIAKNFKVFEKPDAARNSIFIGILSTILLFTGILLAPEDIINKIPQPLIPAIYTLIIAGLVDWLQGAEIKKFLKSNGQKASNWIAAGYGFVGLIITLGFSFFIAFSMPPEGYEKSIDVNENVVLYYNDEIKEEKTKEIANELKNSGYFNGSRGADLFLDNHKDHYRLKFVLPDTSAIQDPLFVRDFNEFENYLNEKLSFSKRIVIGFTDINLLSDFDLPEYDDNINKIPPPLMNLERYKINAYHTIFYNSSMPIADVKKLEQAINNLKNYFPKGQNIDVILLNNGNDYTIKFFVNKPLWQRPTIINSLKSTVEYVKACGIEKEINLVLIDSRTFEEKQI
jgi:hypothetical protein